ncbi:ATPase involved in DNA repair-like protein [Shewanella halifaxensis HAW-EB4]|uniref:ATPase involved in DNA repair-like protein n=1 Tax=Shewanella halifaxensis (strain HAW-EB4) TaxID=458817 RepID=B0TRC5_SHEHH|nr:AAA family ATPase [Shewanella halifaxensis]ABZ75097.1 ATPase involved in DNA repair-like protein [Shewanella halifaxensis HAW-EB4]
MKIKKVEIEAFRAYKSKSDGTFDFTNQGDIPSNFVAIYAPNGFGKSSFYDAVEWAVTNHLERLGGEYNRSNFVDAAKITKDKNVGQKILRNKYVDDKVVTKVVVSTTRAGLFERKLPKTRSNSRDLRFGVKSQRENEFFRRVILSQDEIDRFLREAKPKERYTKFMTSFGGDIEIARQELSVLISDNETELNNLNNQHELLIKEIKQPIDLSVFEHFNSVAAELNAVGENIILPDEKFSSQNEHLLNAHLVSRQHELNTSFQANTETTEALVNRLEKIPEIEIHVRDLAEHSPDLTRLSKGITDADKYQALLDSHEKYVTAQKQAHARLNSLIVIAESTDTFLQIESRLLELSTQKKALTEERSKTSTQLEALNQTLSELNTELKAVDNRTLLLRTSIDNASPVYTEISNRRAHFAALGLQIAEKEIAIQKEKVQFNVLNRELSEISTLKITPDLLLTGKVDALLFEQGKIDQLTRCYADLDLIEVNITALHTTKKALTEQMELHERLLSIGLDYLSVQPSNICPLCTSPHASVEALQDKIKNRNLLSDLSQENTKKLSLSSKRQKELRDIIQSIVQQAIEAQVKQLNGLHNKVNEVGARLTQTERDKSTLEAEYKSIENRVVELEKSVWGLSHVELVSRVEAELKELLIKRSNLLEQKTSATTQITLFTKSFKAKDLELQSLISEVERKGSEHAYVTVQAYLNENAIVASSLQKHCEIKRKELDTEVLKYKVEVESLTSQCNALQQEMQVGGTWINFPQLKQQKEALELRLAHSQSAVNAFYGSLSHIILVRSEDTLEKVKEFITGAIEERQRRSEELNILSSKIKLLSELLASFKPYIRRISLQEELTDVERQLEQRSQVYETLAAEKEVVVGYLKTLINNFFYEDLINSIYRKIDPHPAFKKVEFKPDFDSGEPSLNIVVSDGDGELISPILFFSTAQINILSLSVFLASALHARDDEDKPIDVILIDDPIQSMDSINILSTIDLLRSISLQFDKQVIISTHDENFFGLLQRKIPAEVLGSKFLKLEKFGVVVPVEPFLN